MGSSSVQRLDVDNPISLRNYFRMADNTLKQADIFRAEKKIIDLYARLLRFTSLAVESIPSHRDYKTSLESKKKDLRMRLSDVLIELEKLKPVVKQKIDELNPKPIPEYNLQAHPPNDHAKEECEKELGSATDGDSDDKKKKNTMN